MVLARRAFAAAQEAAKTAKVKHEKAQRVLAKLDKAHQKYLKFYKSKKLLVSQAEFSVAEAQRNHDEAMTRVLKYKNNAQEVRKAAIWSDLLKKRKAALGLISGKLLSLKAEYKESEAKYIQAKARARKARKLMSKSVAAAALSASSIEDANGALDSVKAQTQHDDLAASEQSKYAERVNWFLSRRHEKTAIMTEKQMGHLADEVLKLKSMLDVIKSNFKDSVKEHEKALSSVKEAASKVKHMKEEVDEVRSLVPQAEKEVTQAKNDLLIASGEKAPVARVETELSGMSVAAARANLMTHKAQLDLALTEALQASLDLTTAEAQAHKAAALCATRKAEAMELSLHLTAHLSSPDQEHTFLRHKAAQELAQEACKAQDRAEAALAKAKADLEAARARVTAAKKALKDAQALLEQATRDHIVREGTLPVTPESVQNAKAAQAAAVVSLQGVDHELIKAQIELVKLQGRAHALAAAALTSREAGAQQAVQDAAAALTRQQTLVHRLTEAKQSAQHEVHTTEGHLRDALAEQRGVLGGKDIQGHAPKSFVPRGEWAKRIRLLRKAKTQVLQILEETRVLRKKCESKVAKEKQQRVSEVCYDGMHHPIKCHIHAWARSIHAVQIEKLLQVERRLQAKLDSYSKKLRQTLSLMRQ